MHRTIVLIGLVLILLFSGIRLADPAPVKSLRLAYFDYLQQSHPRDWQDLPVRVVDLDEASLAKHGQWPWPRTTLADLTNRLRDYGAVVVAFDTLFSEPDRYSPARLLDAPRIKDLITLSDTTTSRADLDNDAVFAAALGQMPTVLGVAAAIGGDAPAMAFDKAGFASLGQDPLGGASRIQQTTPLVPALAEAAAGIGSINLSPRDSSDTVRRVPLVWQSGKGALPALTLETLRLALGETTYVARGVADVSRAMQSVQVGAYVVPTDSNGEFWLHFRKEDPRLYVSAADVLAPDFDAALQDRLKGHLVLVGTSAAGLLDIRTTALGERVPGVSVHAQILEQILTESYLKRADMTAVLEVFSFVCIGLILASVMSPAVAIFIVSHAQFVRQGVLFDASFPILAGVLTYGILTAYQYYVSDWEKRKIRKSFSQYLAPSVLAEIERKGYDIELGGELRPVTVMFSDIRNFTPLAERLTPQALVSLLNDLFTILTQKILGRDGTVDKYIGDNVMAFWNAPLPIDGHERAAAKAALDMRAALGEFSARQDDDKQSIALATGLAVGEVLVGNIGSEQRFNYSVLGDTVNVAARAEAACRPIGFDIVATQAARDAADDLAWLFAGSIALKGKSARVALFVLVGDEAVAGSPAFEALAQAHDALLAAIRSGEDTAVLLEHCTQQLGQVEPRLAEFYAKIPDRYGDFRAD